MSIKIMIDSGRMYHKRQDENGITIAKNMYIPLRQITSQINEFKDAVIASIDGLDPYIFGASAGIGRMLDVISGATEEEHIKHRCLLFTLFLVARNLLAGVQNPDKLPEITLGLTHTRTNAKYTPELHQALKKRHTVQFLNFRGEVTQEVKFKIVKIVSYEQPLPILYDYLATKKDANTLTRDDLWKKHCIVEFGSKTFLISLVQKDPVGQLMISTSDSYHYGSWYIYASIKKELESKGIMSTEVELEKAIRVQGGNYCGHDIIPLFNYYLEQMVRKISNVVETFITDNPANTLLIGGGNTEHYVGTTGGKLNLESLHDKYNLEIRVAKKPFEATVRGGYWQLSRK